jgi:hypothetical protein
MPPGNPSSTHEATHRDGRGWKAARENGSRNRTLFLPVMSENVGERRRAGPLTAIREDPRPGSSSRKRPIARGREKFERAPRLPFLPLDGLQKPSGPIFEFCQNPRKTLPNVAYRTRCVAPKYFPRNISRTSEGA